MARMSLPTPTLHTAGLRLRPFTDADADALFALHSDARVLRYWDSPPWSDRARAVRFIAACRSMAEEGTGARLAIDRLPEVVLAAQGHVVRHPAGVAQRLHRAGLQRGQVARAGLPARDERLQRA